MLGDRRKIVFISGSAYEYGRFGDTGKAFIRDLSKNLLKNDFQLVSGFGSGVGAYIIEGAMEEIYLERKEKIGTQLQVYPFPFAESGSHSEIIKTTYREDMISQADVVIFLFGNKLEDISVKEADGMLKEFEIARANKAVLIPVGVSGYISEKLWNTIITQYDDFFETRENFELYRQLGDPYTDPDQLIDIIIQIAKAR